MEQPLAMMKFHLAPHVYACETGGQLVLLDLRRDEYMGLAGAQARSLAAHVAEWPRVGEASEAAGACAGNPPVAEERVFRLLERLFDQGVLTREACGKRVESPDLPEARVKLVRERPGIRPEVKAGDAVRLLIASLRAAFWLRFRSLEATLRHVRDRKEAALRSSHLRAVKDPPEAAEVTERVTAFVYLRPLLFGARDKCLFDSLALIEYLALCRIYPTLVFGVRVAPFAAHCWVQEGPVVYNDSPEHVRRYTPILKM